MNYDALTIGELVDKAEQLEEGGMLNEAFEVWGAAVRRESDPIILCQFGDVAMRLGKWSEAEQAFLSALKLAPELPSAYNHLGILLLEQGKPKNAEDYFKRSLKIEETASIFTLLGVAHLDLGMTEEARKSFRMALNLDSSYEEAYYNLAVIMKYEQPTEAIALLHKALELDPEYAIAHRELGWMLRLIDQYPEAEYHLRRAIELDGADGWAYIYLGNLLWATDDQGGAEQAFKKAIETWSDASPPYWCLAFFYERQGRSQEAEHLYKEALLIDPENIEANLRFGLYLKDIGEYIKAKDYLERANKIYPDDERIKAALSEL